MFNRSEQKRKLFLVTQNYPYGNGEKTFIEPELFYLLSSNKFDITIISNAMKDERRTADLPKDVTLIWMENTSVLKVPVKLLKCIFKYFLSQETREERKDILKSKKSMGKLLESIFFYVRSQIFWDKLQRKEIDFQNAIVYTYWNSVETLALALHKCDESGMKLISRIHGYDLYDERTIYGRQPFKRTIDATLDKLFFIAQTGKEYYLHKMGDSPRYCLSYLGTINKNKFCELRKKQRRKGSFLIISCSNIIPIKRIDLIVDALSKITEFDVEWIHFGDGFLRKDIEKMAKQKLQPKSNISYSFLGQTDNERIMRFYEYNYVDCFITTSQTEGCPVTIQEAMSYGIPVIGTDVGEIPYMIEGNGILLDKNPEIVEVTQAIKKLYFLSDEEREFMHCESRRLWEMIFNGAINYSDFLQKLLEL